MSKAACDQDVYKHGTSLGMFAMTKEQAEAYCISETERTGYPHDWHFVGGRVHVLALLPQNVPPEAKDVNPIADPLE